MSALVLWCFNGRCLLEAAPLPHQMDDEGQERGWGSPLWYEALGVCKQTGSPGQLVL